jgi:L-ascorbate metabolism protein UlaG (beta-lactamase superfamily)
MILYGTDSPYGKHFAEIKNRFKIDVAILPIGHVAPDFWAGKRYLSVAEAIQAFVDLGADTLIPNAYGAFAWDASSHGRIRDQLNEEIFKQSLRERVRVLKPGETFELV